MTEVQSVAIAGLRFALRPEVGWSVVEDDPRYEPFLNPPENLGETAVDVRLHFELPDLRGLPILFDTEDAWCAYRDGGDTLIDMAPSATPERLWTARLRADQSEVAIYCGRPLLITEQGQPQAAGPGTTHGAIRNPLRYPLDQLLMLGLLPPLGGLVVHGAGATRNGVGLAFPGRSGAGKSTLMRLMRGVPGVHRLTDDRVALRTGPEGPRIFGTPWAGDERVAANASAPLRALIFLHHSNEDRLVPIDAHEALRQLLPTACIPWYDAEGAGRGLAVCGTLVGELPAYELHFRPQQTALSVLDSLW